MVDLEKVPLLAEGGLAEAPAGLVRAPQRVVGGLRDEVAAREEAAEHGLATVIEGIHGHPEGPGRRPEPAQGGRGGGAQG